MGKENTDYHFCCSECGARFDLSTKYGRKAAQYGLCGKCGVEFVIRTYKKSNFLAKVFFFIPYLLIKIRYNKVYKTEHQVEKTIEELSSEPIELVRTKVQPAARGNLVYFVLQDETRSK